MIEPTVVEVSVELGAPPEQVFSYFTDATRYVEWMGLEATLEPRPGGAYRVQSGDGFAAVGEFLEVEPHRLYLGMGSRRRSNRAERDATGRCPATG